MLERSFSVRVFSAVSWLVLSSTTSSRWLAYFSSFSTMLSRIFTWLQQENITKRSVGMVFWIVLARLSASRLTPSPSQFISDVMNRVQTCQGRCPSAAFWLTQTEVGGRGFRSSRPSAGGGSCLHTAVHSEVGTAVHSEVGAAVPLGKASPTARWSLERKRKSADGWNRLKYLWPLEGFALEFDWRVEYFPASNYCHYKSVMALLALREPFGARLKSW